jgi:hypothetical protein
MKPIRLSTLFGPARLAAAAFALIVLAACGGGGGGGGGSVGGACVFDTSTFDNCTFGT